jgi:hypothetical protein
MAKELLECVHGIFAQTCMFCKDKTKEQINGELQDFGDGAVKSNLKYDYQEVIQVEETNEIDNAYDLEDSSDF